MHFSLSMFNEVLIGDDPASYSPPELHKSFFLSIETHKFETAGSLKTVCLACCLEANPIILSNSWLKTTELTLAIGE